MSSEDAETPAVVDLADDDRPRPATTHLTLVGRPVATTAVVTPPEFATPMPAGAPRPTLSLKKPPFGRPPGALTITEMVERITKDVGRATSADVARRHDELRAEIAAEVNTAMSLGKTAIVMNALTIITIVLALAFPRVLPARSSALVLAAVTAILVAALRLGARRPTPTGSGQ
jgi:hypothetical protein